ncbi:MAG: hypothetical protein ACPG6B_07355 [Oceanihabitans sp.]
MNEQKTKTPIYFWFVSTPILLFGLLGAIQMPLVFSSSSDPAWVKALYIIGIICLFIGSIYLVLRRKVALYFFLSFILFMTGHRIYMFGFSEWVPEAPLKPFVPIIIVALFSIFSAFINKKNWMK